MELPYEWRPLEVLRRTQLFFSAWRLDFDCRFPEIRNRKLLELRLLQIPEKAILEISDVLRAFHLERSVIPLLDFWALFEWNLRYQFYFLRAEIAKSMSALQSPRSDLREDLLADLRIHLEQLQLRLERLRLSSKPSPLELSRVRFQISGVEEEAAYLKAKILPSDPFLKIG